jgi:two-component system CheB/CheR fusion protein
MNKQPHEPIRIWSAACATGQEAYSLAMVLAEAWDRTYLQRVQIFATDIDMERLSIQRGLQRCSSGESPATSAV